MKRRRKLIGKKGGSRLTQNLGIMAAVAGALGLVAWAGRHFDADGGGVAEAAQPDGGVAPDGGAAPLSPNVRISMYTTPALKAEVRWGGKKLGIINPLLKPDGRGKKQPFVLERPRDSGPIDLVVTAKDYLPVHTRAYTFNDSKMVVKMTPAEEKNTLFGYREELPDAGPEAGVAVAAGARPDGGVPVMAPLPPPPGPAPVPPGTPPPPAR